MKIALHNYTFDHTAKKITCLDYAIEGLGLKKLLAVVNVTRGVVMFKANSPTVSAAIESTNVIALTGIDTTAMADSDALYIVYDDPNAAQLVNINNSLDALYDSILAVPKGTTPVRLTASGQVLPAPGKIVGLIIADGSTGSIKLWNNTSGSGTILMNTRTFAVGNHDMFNLEGSVAIYATITGAVDVTFLTHLNQ